MLAYEADEGSSSLSPGAIRFRRCATPTTVDAKRCPQTWGPESAGKLFVLVWPKG